MKVYNKKGFIAGLFWLILGAASLYIFVYRGMSLFDILLCMAQFGMAARYLVRSFSRNMSDADQDERTQLILQKTRATAFSWVKWLCIGLGLLYVAVYSHTKNELHFAMFVCFALIVIGMVIIEGIMEIYYDHKL